MAHMKICKNSSLNIYYLSVELFIFHRFNLRKKTLRGLKNASNYEMSLGFIKDFKDLISKGIFIAFKLY